MRRKCMWWSGFRGNHKQGVARLKMSAINAYDPAQRTNSMYIGNLVILGGLHTMVSTPVSTGKDGAHERAERVQQKSVAKPCLQIDCKSCFHPSQGVGVSVRRQQQILDNASAISSRNTSAIPTALPASAARSMWIISALLTANLEPYHSPTNNQVKHTVAGRLLRSPCLVIETTGEECLSRDHKLRTTTNLAAMPNVA